MQQWTPMLSEPANKGSQIPTYCFLSLYLAVAENQPVLT